jgi:hypothetical protein
MTPQPVHSPDCQANHSPATLTVEQREIVHMDLKRMFGSQDSIRIMAYSGKTTFQASLLFVTLKKLNRLEKLRIERSCDAINQSKQSRAWTPCRTCCTRCSTSRKRSQSVSTSRFAE